MRELNDVASDIIPALPFGIMQRPFAVTVIIPVFNGEAYLAETLESVLAQTMQAAEILVINDGSTDSTAEIAASFAPRVRLFSRVNAGVSASRNFGAAEAETEWIHFLDADDVWEPSHLAMQMKTLESCPSADVCYSGRRNLVRHTQTGIFCTNRSSAHTARLRLSEVGYGSLPLST